MIVMLLIAVMAAFIGMPSAFWILYAVCAVIKFFSWVTEPSTNNKNDRRQQ